MQMRRLDMVAVVVVVVVSVGMSFGVLGMRCESVV